jgi:hypothetical protein
MAASASRYPQRAVQTPPDAEAALAAQIEGVIGTWDNPAAERDIFGTADPAQIAAVVGAFCLTHFGAPVAAPLFYASSIGAVFGLELTDGRRVVVKAHQPDQPSAFLAAVQQVQRVLVDHRYPCPAPLLGPVPIGRGHVTVERYAADGEFRNPHDPDVRRAMAHHLARLARITRGLVGTVAAAQPPAAPSAPDALWPKPHSVLFDFAATTAGAEWIDDIGWRAKRFLAGASVDGAASTAGRPVIGHNDWSAKHFRFAGSAVRVIYDWDSVRVEPEPVLAGRAAKNFTMTYGTPWEGRVPMAPTLDELRAFIADYEATRGAPFTAAERRTAYAAAAYSMAYTSRCGHAIDPRDGPTAPLPPGSYRAALATYGETLLANPS